MTFRFREKKLTLDQQVFYLSQQLPGFRRVGYIANKLAVWEGLLQPAPFADQYRVRIKYELGRRPDVTLPDLDFAKRRPPHLFSDGTLCLYSVNGIGAWKPKQPLSNIVTMIAHWLWCYELWLVDGKWHGEEFPHQPQLKKAK